MKLFSRLRDQRYCAFCKSPRRLYVKKHIDLTNVVGIVALTAAVTQVAYGSPDPRGLVIFCLLAVFGEIFVYMRWRSSLVCRLCGFDPIIYKKSPERAAQMVNQFFKEQSENPEFWLSKSPLLEVHRRLSEQDRQRRDYASVMGAKRAKNIASPPAMR